MVFLTLGVESLSVLPPDGGARIVAKPMLTVLGPVWLLMLQLRPFIGLRMGAVEIYLILNLRGLLRNRSNVLSMPLTEVSIRILDPILSRALPFPAVASQALNLEQKAEVQVNTLCDHG